MSRPPLLAALACAVVVAWTLLATTPSRAQTCYVQPAGSVNDPYACCTVGCARWCSDRGSQPHRGVDYETGFNRALPAVADGVVVDVFWNDCLGNVVVLRHPDGVYSGYSHLISVHVSPGQGVSRGQHIANSGDEGYCSQGAHLHLTMGWDFSCYRGVGRCFDAWAYIDTHRECRPDRDGDGSYEGDDCDDADAARRPGGREICDGRDNDCDPSVDESVTRVCGTDEGECQAGVQTCHSGEWGLCDGEIPPSHERCDLLDNDCDAEADEARICEHDDAALAASVQEDGSSDIDGDGRADACMRTPEGLECLRTAAFGFEARVRGPAMQDAAGWSERRTYDSLRMGDVDGDGRADVCAREHDRLVCWASAEHAFAGSVVTMPLGPASPGAETAEVWLADVDGDGRLDPCARDVDGLRCLASASGRTSALHALSDAEGFDDVARHGSIRFGDVDGDGRADVCARLSDGLACWLHGVNGFETRIAGPPWSDADGWSAAGLASTWRLADADGDGRDDACARGPDGFGCWLSLGDRFGAMHRGPPMRDAEGWDRREVHSTIRMGDIDGDGASDVCARQPDGVRCWRWTGDSFGRAIEGPPLTDASGWTSPARHESIRLADVSGDGRADVCARSEDALHCWLSEGTHFERQWRASSWNAAAGLDDPSRASTLTISGEGGRRAVALSGSMTCTAQRRAPGALTFGALVMLTLLVTDRRRRGRTRVGAKSGLSRP